MTLNSNVSYRVVCEVLAAILLVITSGLSSWCLYNEHQTAIELATLKAERSAALQKLEELKKDVDAMRYEMASSFRDLNKRLTDHMLDKHVAGGE